MNVNTKNNILFSPYSVSIENSSVIDPSGT